MCCVLCLFSDCYLNKLTMWVIIYFAASTVLPLVNLIGFKNGACCCLPLTSYSTDKRQPSLQSPPSSFRATQKYLPRSRNLFETCPERGSTGAVPAVENCLKVPAPLKRPMSSWSGKASNMSICVCVSLCVCSHMFLQIQIFFSPLLLSFSSHRDPTISHLTLLWHHGKNWKEWNNLNTISERPLVTLTWNVS